MSNDLGEFAAWLAFFGLMICGPCVSVGAVVGAVAGVVVGLVYLGQWGGSNDNTPAPTSDDNLQNSTDSPAH
jgi:hypothetical protein